MSVQKPIIAIDGTAASGKGTLTRRLAAHLGYASMDTGMLYRRVAMTMIQRNLPLEDSESAADIARAINIDDLNDPVLHSAEAGRGASIVAAIPEVRHAMINLQRNFPLLAQERGVILDGRDIGTVICPDAAFKFYIDADIGIRARRRYDELRKAGADIVYETVLNDMKIRDARDAGRANAPMRAAPDAIIIDTSNMTADQVFNYALHTIGSTLS